MQSHGSNDHMAELHAASDHKPESINGHDEYPEVPYSFPCPLRILMLRLKHLQRSPE